MPGVGNIISSICGKADANTAHVIGTSVQMRINLGVPLSTFCGLSKHWGEAWKGRLDYWETPPPRSCLGSLVGHIC